MAYLDHPVAHPTAPSLRGKPSMRGFTMIELLVTIAIAAILLSLAIPSFRSTILNTQRAAANNALVSMLSFARAEALNRRTRVSLCRTSEYASDIPTCATGTGYEDGWIVFVDADANNAPDVKDDVLRRQEGQKTGMTIRGNNNVANRVTFNLSGAATTNGQIAVCDPRGFSDSRVVIVSLGGRARSLPSSDSDVTLTTCTP